MVYLCYADKRLAKIITETGRFSLKIKRDSFQALIEAIIYQQLNGSAANSIYNRFLTYYKNQIPTPEQIISSSDLELSTKVGLSRMKITYLKDLAAHIVDSRLNLIDLPEMQDEEIISQLTKVKGIGRWTAEMFLIFCLGRKDIFPVGDLGVRKAIQRLYSLPELPSPSTMLHIAQSWKPYRSIATWYLWKSLSKFDSIG